MLCLLVLSRSSQNPWVWDGSTKKNKSKTKKLNKCFLKRGGSLCDKITVCGVFTLAILFSWLKTKVDYWIFEQCHTLVSLANSLHLCSYLLYISGPNFLSLCCVYHLHLSLIPPSSRLILFVCIQGGIFLFLDFWPPIDRIQKYWQTTGLQGTLKGGIIKIFKLWIYFYLTSVF